MAKFVASLLLVLIAISMIQTIAMASGHHYNRRSRYGEGSLKRYQCPSQCNRRCKKTQYHNNCILFCNKCCNKCLCVPPGYYQHKEVCPCYNNWKTKEGGPKCP